MLANQVLFAGNRRFVPLAAVTGLLAVAASAASLPVLNHSFESPVVPPGFPAVTTIDNWNDNPDPGYPPGQWDQLTGIFPNAAPGDPRHIDNADGAQVAYFFVINGVGISQQLSSTFASGLSYEVTVGLRGGGAMTVGNTFTVGLFYMDSGSPVTVASTVVTSTADFTTTTLLFEFSATTGYLLPGNAAVGQPIGIALNVTSDNGAPGIAYWEADTVTVTAVPEPETYALVVGGALLGGAMLRRWRRSR